MKVIKKLLTIFLLLIIYSYITNILNLKSNLILLEDEEYKFKTCHFIAVSETASVSSGNESNYKIELKLFGKVNLKTIDVTKIKNLEVIPSGDIIGLKLYTNRSISSRNV